MLDSNINKAHYTKKNLIYDRILKFKNTIFIDIRTIASFNKNKRKKRKILKKVTFLIAGLEE